MRHTISLTLALAIAIAVAVAAGAADTPDVAALQAQCEVAREAKLKPIRNAEIAKCKASERNDPAWCERFYVDYGNAVRRPNGTMSPRMFNDLPECIAAEKARKAALNQ